MRAPGLVHGATFPSGAEDYGAFLRDFLETASSITSEAYAALTALRAEFSESFRNSLETVDAVLCPTGHTSSPASSEVRCGGIDASALASPGVRGAHRIRILLDSIVIHRRIRGRSNRRPVDIPHPKNDATPRSRRGVDRRSGPSRTHRNGLAADHAGVGLQRTRA